MKDHIKHILRNIALISIVSAWLVYATEINTLLQTVNKWDQINADWYNAVNNKLSTVGAASSGGGGPFCVPIVDTASCVSTVAQYGIKNIIYHPIGNWNGQDNTIAGLLMKTVWSGINIPTTISCWASAGYNNNPYFPPGTSWSSISMQNDALGVWVNDMRIPFQAGIHFCYN